MTFKRYDRVYWLRPSQQGDGAIHTIPAVVVGVTDRRVTIEAWGVNGTTRLVSVLPRNLKRRETLGDALDRIEKQP